MTTSPGARPETRIEFPCPDQSLLGFLAGRAAKTGRLSPDIQARDEIETWRAVMVGELKCVPLTLGEARCLADALARQQLRADAYRVIAPVCYSRCHDLFTRTTGDQYGITEDRLLARLQMLGPAADIALEDAFARWPAAAPRTPRTDSPGPGC